MYRLEIMDIVFTYCIFFCFYSRFDFWIQSNTYILVLKKNMKFNEQSSPMSVIQWMSRSALSREHWAWNIDDTFVRISKIDILPLIKITVIWIKISLPNNYIFWYSEIRKKYKEFQRRPIVHQCLIWMWELIQQQLIMALMSNCSFLYKSYYLHG